MRVPRLVIGYGNELRRDDGLGRRIAESAAEHRDNVELLLVHELLPELAESIASAELVVFVDARSDRPEQGILSEELVLSTDSPPWLGHLSDPRALLALSHVLYGASPRAFLVSGPTTDLGMGIGLSDAAARSVPLGVRAVRALLDGDITP